MSMTPKDIIVSSANFGCKYLDDHSIMPAGHNGPYKDSESPVRNNAHWAMIFIKVFELTENQKYLNSALKCINYLKDQISEASPVFICRETAGKDRTNGLIGQAWAIEPFIAIQKFQKNIALQDIAIHITKMHVFDDRKKLWKVCDGVGNPTKFDDTFNHQLWFAAVSSFNGKYDKRIDEIIIQFMNGITKNLILRRNGRIGQALFISPLESYIKPLVKTVVRRNETEYMKLKEVGYHAFNIYAFIMLRENYPDHKFWNSKEFKLILQYLNSKEYKSEIYNSKYGFSYNPPSYEVFASNLHFSDISTVDEKFITELWNHQINTSWNFDEKIMSEGSFDRNTHMARVYECFLCC